MSNMFVVFSLELTILLFLEIALNGQDDIMEELLNRNMELMNVCNSNGLTALHFASGSEIGVASVEFLSRFCPNGLLVNARDKWKRTPLHLAVKFGRSVSIIELIRIGADGSASDYLMRTPLHYAVLNQDIQTVEMLRQLPSVYTVDVADRDGLTPLHYAAGYGMSAMVDCLLEGEKPATASIHDLLGRTPHFFACMNGDVKVLEKLYTVYFVDELDHLNRNLLHYSARNGSVHSIGCLEFLISLSEFKSKRISTLNSLDSSALSQDSRQSLGSSLTEGPPLFDVNQKDVFGRTPLMYASEHDSNGIVVEFLISCGAKVDAVDHQGLYSVNYAAAAGNLSSLQILLETFYWSDTVFAVCPAQSAAFFGHSECLEILLQHGIYDNLAKAIEYSRAKSCSGCFEVLEKFVASCSTEDESLAELSHYFTANDSFHQKYLRDSLSSTLSLNDTITDLSKISFSSEEEGIQANDTLSSSPEKNASGDAVNGVIEREPMNGNHCSIGVNNDSQHIFASKKTCNFELTSGTESTKELNQESNGQTNGHEEVEQDFDDQVKCNISFKTSSSSTTSTLLPVVGKEKTN